MRRIPHDSIYTDRRSERALCYDFPADKAFIDGLHEMQSYFVARDSNIEIPVVRVMNTAHWLVSYMYATECSGDQREYDTLTYNSVGRDKQLMYVSLIVLIAMLSRTEGPRAKACRSMMLENRPEDFYEGVSLYEQWLDGGLEHYTDEDFQIDLMNELNEYKLKLQNAEQQIEQLKKQIAMKEEENRHVTNVYNYGTYNDIHDNPYATIYATEPKLNTAEIEAKAPSVIPPDFFCISERFPEENIRERLAAELSMATSKIDYCRALYRLQYIGCINLNQYASDAQRAIVFNRFQDKFTLSASDFCKARLTR